VTNNKEGNLIVNLKVAKAAGLNVTPTFLRKASRVMQQNHAKDGVNLC
jgi:hypothetical protein